MHTTRRYLKSLACFALGALFLLVASVTLALLSGEVLTLEEVIDTQAAATEDVLYGWAYSDETAVYKLKATLKRQPKILVLGTSRVMEINSTMFRQRNAFFNAGGMISSTSQLVSALERVSKSVSPELIIVGIDQWCFNGKWHKTRGSAKHIKSNAKIMPWHLRTVESGRGIIVDYFAGKIPFANLFVGHNIGINARVRANGFRNDGSYHYGSFADGESTLEERLAENLQRIRKGNARFEHGKEMETAAVEEVRAFLAEARQRQVEVVGFLPPFAPTIAAAIDAAGTRYGYMRGIYAALAPVFKENGYQVFDFTDVRNAGFTDQDFWDGYHSKAPLNKWMLTVMAQANAKLSGVLDAEVPPSKVAARDYLGNSLHD